MARAREDGQAPIVKSVRGPPRERPAQLQGRLLQTEREFYRHHDGGREFGGRSWLKPPLPDRIQRFLIQPKIRPRSVENTGRSNRPVLQNDGFEKRKPFLARPYCAARIILADLHTSAEASPRQDRRGGRYWDRTV